MKLLFRTHWMLPVVLANIGWTLARLETIHEWQYIDYLWDHEGHKLDAILTGIYNYENIFPVDFQPLRDGRVLVSTPKYFNNPASLSMISNVTGEGGSLLSPWPNWDWHDPFSCWGITSVNRIVLDDCNRLWIVDSGKIGASQVCPAQLLAFNPETDEVILRVRIPNRLSHNSADPSKGRLEIQAVETDGDWCERTWVYIGDPEGFGLVIWDRWDIWRLENDKVYAPDPTATTFSIVGENITLKLGVSNLLLSPTGFLDKRYLFFRPFASLYGYAVSLNDLHNSKTGASVTYYRTNFTTPSQKLAVSFSKSGVFVGGFSTRSVIACWNIQDPVEPDFTVILIEDDETLQFTTGSKIMEGFHPGFEHEQYSVMSNRAQKFLLGNMNFTDTNFRILSSNLAGLVIGTVCEPQPNSTAVQTLEDKMYFVFQRDTNPAVPEIFPAMNEFNYKYLYLTPVWYTRLFSPAFPT
nr:major royal jelly protein 1-like [Neodiprion pinetum]